ncbi:GntR family transcriptional regulator [Ferrovibrio sp.]|uniref:GntR family transcriptional regulator n=1 Tax=Ferrovibrio sp. TaxID=1917215 RepID=UPI0025BE45CA|nr:GntR family transcriptional regulator [Ferrovibrio sp.]MBX3454870.1 GntR family transcriptional regulator [Ferrovibrio sp.]
MPESQAAPPNTSTQFERVLLRLRGMIMEGRFAPHAKMLEVDLAKQLDVSRTPVRLALQALAQEGLLTYAPQRGFTVRGFSVSEIITAVDIRGRLEAMACEMAAQSGLDAAAVALLERNIADTAALLQKPHYSDADVEAWSNLNGDFHDAFLTAANSPLLTALIQQTGTVPLSSPRIIVATPSNIDEIMAYVRDALKMHEIVFDAVLRRDPARARRMMEEHIYQGRARLQEVLQSLGKQREMVYSRSFRLIDTV